MKMRVIIAAMNAINKLAQSWLVSSVGKHCIGIVEVMG